MIVLKLELTTTAELVAEWLSRYTAYQEETRPHPGRPYDFAYWLSATWSSFGHRHYFACALEYFMETWPLQAKRVSSPDAPPLRVEIEQLTPEKCRVVLTYQPASDNVVEDYLRNLLAELIERWPEANNQVPETASYQDGWGTTRVVSLRIHEEQTEQATTAFAPNTGGGIPESGPAPGRGGRPTVSDVEMLEVVAGWLRAKAEGKITQEAYAVSVDRSPETIRSYMRKLKAKGLIE